MRAVALRLHLDKLHRETYYASMTTTTAKPPRTRRQRRVPNTPLVWLMTEHGLTNSDIARAVGVSETSVSNWRRGHYHPSYEHAAAIAAMVGQSPDTVARELGAKPPAPIVQYEEDFPLTPLGRAAHAAGVTVDSIADSCGVHPHTVYRWAHGVHGARLHRVPRIAKVLGCSDEAVYDLLR